MNLDEKEYCPFCGQEMEYLNGYALPRVCPNYLLHEEQEE